MKFRTLLNYISEEELEILSVETKVNHQVKKLKGSIMFKLILYTILESKHASLRVMETFFNSSKFKLLADVPEIETKYNSLSDRLTNINYIYFEEIFKSVFKKFNNHLGEQNSLQIYDTTMVALSSKLVNWGMRVGSKTNKVQLKFTVGIQGSLPCTFKVFDKQSDLCEDNTIPTTIFEYKENKEGVVVFDRGVQKRDTFVKMSNENIIFVTRIKTNVNYEIIQENTFKLENNKSVVIKKDLNIFFIKRGVKKPIKTPFRLIKSVIKESNEEIYFITNNFDLSPYEIADIYKKRWEIEVFFKFLKQELNFKHLINRSHNGIKVMVYMTLILSILITVYKKENNLSGYKIVKLKITNELHDSLLKEIILLAGGNPSLVSQYLNDS